ncbi:MAG: chromate efflux transporter [Rhodospirillales bacterium]|jgi:chromate transporter|nr:chromate efflux transporter [Rhodospirillales bacterium]
MMEPQQKTAVAFGEAFRLWLKIGLLGFGGPAGQIALMHRLLVDEKKWISESRFLHALNYCMLLPGPEAQQLATYMGWLLHRTAGGLAAGILFVAPGAIVMWGLSLLYATLHDVPLVQAVFFGVKAAVLAVVVEALLRISKRALKNKVMYLLAGLAFVAIFFFDLPFPLIVGGAALIGFLGGRRWPAIFIPAKPADKKGDAAVIDAAFLAGDLDHAKPSARRAVKVALVWMSLWFLPLLAFALILGVGHVFTQEGIFFSKMAVVTFGGAYAVLAYVAQQAVGTHGWLAPGEMLDGLGLAETTPGPLIMVLQFVGFLAAFRNPGGLDPVLAGTIGALVTTWVTFVPCFLWIFLGAPYIEALRGNKNLNAALTAITASVVGVILNLSVWFALHVLFARVEEKQVLGMKLSAPDPASLDAAALLLAMAAILATLKYHVGMLKTLGACAAVGAVIHFMRL